MSVIAIAGEVIVSAVGGIIVNFVVVDFITAGVSVIPADTTGSVTLTGTVTLAVRIF